MSSAVKTVKKPVKRVSKHRANKKKVVKKEKFVIDCKNPVNDGILDTSALEQYLVNKIKVGGKTGNMGSKVSVAREQDTRIVVTAEKPFSKRYLKYLTKKFLKKNDLREWLRVVATNRNAYELRYFNIQENEEGAAEE